MMDRWIGRALAATVAVMAPLIALPVYGATVTIAGPAQAFLPGSCNATSPSSFMVSAAFLGEHNDTGGQDAVASYLLDGNNVIISSGVTLLNLAPTSSPVFAFTSHTPTARPFTFVFYDLGPGEATLAEGTIFNLADAIPGSTLQFDPALLDASCLFYPYATPPVPSVPPVPEPPTAAISGFLQSRIDLLLANTPGIDRRLARLNGQTPPAQEPGAALLGYVSTLAQGSPVPVSTSLAAIEAMDGAAEPSPFDIWIDGTFALFDNAGPHGRFSTVSLGADYLINPDLLVGGFLSLDRIDQFNWASTDVLGGTGWMAGPYLTARLSDYLYLDLLAGAGTADNTINTGLGFVDSFSSTRWLVDAALSGSFSSGP